MILIIRRSLLGNVLTEKFASLDRSLETALLSAPRPENNFFDWTRFWSGPQIEMIGDEKGLKVGAGHIENKSLNCKINSLSKKYYLIIYLKCDRYIVL